MGKIVKLTETDLRNLVNRIIKEEKRTNPIRRDVSDFSKFKNYSRNTKWGIKEPSFNSYVESYGPFTLYINPDDSIKIACIGGDCYDQTDRKISRERAAELLGVNTLEDIQ